jgi:nitrogenase molybdenum-iron protein alpha chain
MDIGRYTGKEDLARQVIEEEKARYTPEIEKAKKILKGKKAFIAMGASFAFEYTRMLNELGIETLHAVAFHYDPMLDNSNQEEEVAAATDVKELQLDVPTSVNDAQQAETDLIVRNFDPDFVLSRGHDMVTYFSKKGLPAMNVDIGLIVMGYRGLAYFADCLVELLHNTNLIKHLGEHYVSPFTEAFDGTEPFQFYEGEDITA